MIIFFAEQQNLHIKNLEWEARPLFYPNRWDV